MRTNIYLILFIMSFIGVSAQMKSVNYESPANGIASTGGLIQSQNYGGSAAILWFNSLVTLSANYTQIGIGNLEILNGKNTTYVAENNYEDIQNSVFPNPVREESMFRFSAKRIGTASLEIFDYTGVKVYGEVINITSPGLTTIPLRKFYGQSGAGVFMIKLSTETEFKTMIILKI
ncbi:MAG: hypothetical protein HYZ54_06545 [Ignavibacteriae bacterium]|nr:hypothetical protein [Ignavibacteriota bacterium]